ncbi:MAG: DUF3343 domain-containing protein [Oscillospiraceae bacterium]|nr:DUF3343 domain-containing protein [Oscillospiraceae bacterium]
MTSYVATFHTHLGALLSNRSLGTAGLSPRMTPVPRKLSSSCGTCVRYEADEPHFELMDGDLEAVYAVTGSDGFRRVEASGNES